MRNNPSKYKGVNKPMMYTIEIQILNIRVFFINNLYFEHDPFQSIIGGVLWDRLGFQVSDDGSTWFNADISGMISSTVLLPPWTDPFFSSSGGCVANSLTAGTTTIDVSRGWIFPERLTGTDSLEETRRDASGNPGSLLSVADASQNALFFSAYNDYNVTGNRATGEPGAARKDSMKRFIKFFFRSS